MDRSAEKSDNTKKRTVREGSNERKEMIFT